MNKWHIKQRDHSKMMGDRKIGAELEKEQEGGGKGQRAQRKQERVQEYLTKF